MQFLLVTLPVAALLVVSEWWFRAYRKPSEFSRKFIHITVGSFVAFWPYFLTRQQILLISAAFVVVVLVSKYTGVFKAIHTVERPTLGELFFALAVGAAALMTANKAVYVIALLHMSLADGLAAIVGTRFGANNQYKVLGNRKSVAGTATFFIVSVLLLSAFVHLTHADSNPVAITLLASAASFVENAGVYGLDNLLVPLLIVGLLG